MYLEPRIFHILILRYKTKEMGTQRPDALVLTAVY